MPGDSHHFPRQQRRTQNPSSVPAGPAQQPWHARKKPERPQRRDDEPPLCNSPPVHPGHRLPEPAQGTAATAAGTHTAGSNAGSSAPVDLLPPRRPGASAPHTRAHSSSRTGPARPGPHLPQTGSASSLHMLTCCVRVSRGRFRRRRPSRATSGTRHTGPGTTRLTLTRRPISSPHADHLQSSRRQSTPALPCPRARQPPPYAHPNR